MNQQMLLSKDEKKYYDQIYQKIIDEKKTISQNLMKQFLISKGGLQQKEIAEYIVEQSIKISNSESTKVNKEGFRIMMKYLGQHQSGKDVKQINIITAENVTLPKLVSKKAKEKKERNQESQLMLSKIDFNKIADEDQEESKQDAQQNQRNNQNNNKNKYPNLDMSIYDANQRIPSFIQTDQKNQFDPSGLQDTGKFPASSIIEQQNQPIRNKSLNQNDDELLNTFTNTNMQNISRIFLSTINNFNSETKDEKMKKSKIEIRGFEVKEGTYLSKSYVLYNIHYGEQSEKVERRYREFEDLNNYLLQKKEFQGLIIPKLPPKQVSISQLIGTQVQDSEFQIKRMADLEDYLNKINSSVILSEDPIFQEFITNKNTFQQKSQNTMFSKVGQLYNAITSQSLTENSEYLQAMITQKFNEYYKQEQTPQSETGEIDEIMEQINKYQQHVDNLQQLLYDQYQLEKSKREKIQSLTRMDDQPIEQISKLENFLTVQSAQYHIISDKKKEVWKEFRSIYSHIESAKQSHDMLLAQIRHQQFLNHLKLKKISHQERNSQEYKSKILQIDEEIKQSELEISKTKELLKEELKKFLENLKKKVKESLLIFQEKTYEELSIDEKQK